jgi:hypothetical protein
MTSDQSSPSRLQQQQQQAQAAAALASFGAGNPSAQEAIVRAGGIPKLVSLFDSPDPTAQKHSTQAVLVRRLAPCLLPALLSN